MSNLIPDGWEIKSIDEVATVFAGGTPSRSKPEYYIGNIPWVKSGEVNARLIYRTEETISEIAVKESSAKWAKSGSVLVAMYGATAGKVAKLMIDATLNQAVSAINGKNGATDNDFLLYAIESNSRELLNTVQGSGQPNLSGQLIKSLSFPVPPLPEQQKIATILSSVDDVIEKTRAQIDKLKGLKTGMMQELLTKGIGHTEFKATPDGLIPANWELVDANTICEKITKGTTPPKSGYLEHSRIPFLRVNNLHFDNKIHFEKGVLFLARDVHEGFLARSVVYPGDVLMNIVGPPLGKVAIAPNTFTEYNINQAIIIYRCNTSEVVNRFFLHYLTSNVAQNWLQTRSKKTSGQQNLTIELCKDLPVPLPPILEQQLIVSRLDSVDQLIEEKFKKYQATVNLKTSLMQDLLTGKVRVKLTDKESAAS